MTATIEDRVTVVHVTGPKLKTTATTGGLPEITPPYVTVHTVRTDMPTGLTELEERAYIRGYARGCMTYARKHSAPIGPDTPQEERTALRLELEEQRQPTAHRAGIAALKKHVQKYGTPERLAEILPKPARARKSAPKVETPAETPETVTPAPVVEKTTRKRRAPKTAPDTVPAPLPRMTYGAARQSRRELAAARRAAGLPLSGPDWIAAKVAAGIVDGDTREMIGGAA